jgi:hypothetical protein
MTETPARTHGRINTLGEPELLPKQRTRELARQDERQGGRLALLGRTLAQVTRDLVWSLGWPPVFGVSLVCRAAPHRTALHSTRTTSRSFPDQRESSATLKILVLRRYALRALGCPLSEKVPGPLLMPHDAPFGAAIRR